MWKKVVFLAVGILAIAVMVTGIVSVVNADDPAAGTADQTPPLPPRGGPHFGPPGGPRNGEMLDRVAQILNIDKQKLVDAFQQAGKELGQKRGDEMFSRLVTDGKLTQEQADQYKAWLQSKPAGVPGFGFGDATRQNEMLSKLLADGKITQAQYDAWKAWIAQKPGFDLPRPERPAGGPAGGPPWHKPAPAK